MTSDQCPKCGGWMDRVSETEFVCDTCGRLVDNGTGTVIESIEEHVHDWKPLSSDAESSDVCACGAEKTILGKIYEPHEHN